MGSSSDILQLSVVLKKEIWKQRDVSKVIKICSYYALIISIVIYTGETSNLKMTTKKCFWEWLPEDYGGSFLHESCQNGLYKKWAWNI